MSLRNYNWGVGYSTDEMDLVKDFYEPAMARSVSYDRAVGYFSSSALALISNGIQRLYEANGKIRIIASPVMSEKDREAIKAGVIQAKDAIDQNLLKYMDKQRLSEDEIYRLSLLTGMIADGLLEMKIALKDNLEDGIGLFHEKVGVFVDRDNDYISFIGSPNESWNGWVGNAESFALHTSWGPAAQHAAHEKALFEKTWERKRERVPVFSISDKIVEELFKKFPPKDPSGHPKTINIPFQRPFDIFPRLPKWLNSGENLRDYQKNAINHWLGNKGRGIFAMATGTGKTVTALAASVQLFEALKEIQKSLLILVVVPSKDLVKQWMNNAIDFNYSPICCSSENRQNWPTEFEGLVRYLDYSSGAIGFVITTAETLTKNNFQNILNKHKSNKLIIADEMHSLGTPRRLRSLPNCNYRLGLSATPSRHGDEEGTSQLVDYFGTIVQSISIKQAIALKALVPYEYFPIFVPLSNEEMGEYLSLSKKIAMIFQANSDKGDFFDKAGFLLIKRSRLLAHAESKLAHLRALMEKRKNEKYMLIYAAEGSHPLSNLNQLDQIVDIVGEELQISLNTYTAETPSGVRENHQKLLKNGMIQALVAMKCLDEGIDIPEAQCGIILASTQNPRQFVQRRGRILRRSPQSDKEKAVIFDFLVAPENPPDKTSTLFSIERRLIGQELSRALELASASINGIDSPPQVLVDVLRKYDLLELLAGYGAPPKWIEGEISVY